MENAVELDSHSQIIVGVFKQMRDVFEMSGQGIYIYLDDQNKVCNSKFAAMLGYASPEEWASVKQNFPTAFVAEKSQRALVETYQRAVERGTGSSINIVWKRKTGGTVKTQVILVPLSFEDHRMALHFVTES